MYVKYTSPWAGFELTTKVIDTDCTGSYKSNYHTIITGFKEEEFKNISPIDFYIKLCPAVLAILDLWYIRKIMKF